MNGGMASSSSERPPEDTDACWSAHLVAREGDEVAVPFGDVGGQVGNRLTGVDQAEGADGMCGVGQLAYRGECAEHVRGR